MFLGEFRHSLDPKGRLVLPSEIRSSVEEGAVLTKSLVDRYLVGFTASDFADLARRVAEETAKDPQIGLAERRWFASARQVTPDKAGRILIPPTLREHAGLENDVVIAGVNERFEIWDAAEYDAAQARAEPLMSEMAKKIPQLRF